MIHWEELTKSVGYLMTHHYLSLKLLVKDWDLEQTQGGPHLNRSSAFASVGLALGMYLHCILPHQNMPLSLPGLSHTTHCNCDVYLTVNSLFQYHNRHHFY